MMTLMILGIVLWWGAHLFKRIDPARRAAMGDKAKGPVAVALVVALVLIVVGYRGAEFWPVWTPPEFLTHVNNALMILAFYLYAASGAKTWITRRVRHPQLTAIKLWATAHLLVNGDVASIVLFGSMLAWAVVEVIVINKAEPVWTRLPAGPVRKEVTTVIATLGVVAVVMAIHNWLGVQPWG